MATFAEALSLARQALASGRFAEAESIYRQLLAAAPQVPELWHEMGLLQLQAGKPDAAQQFLERTVTLNPQSAAFLSNLGLAYRQRKRAGDAAECFRRAMSSGAATPELYNNLALALKDAGQEQDALAAFDAALALRGDYANGHFNRANLLLEVGRLEEAAAGYRRAIELQPQDAAAWCKLGVAYYDGAEMDAALECFSRALEVRSIYPEARRNRGMVCLAQGDFARGWPEWEYRTECDGFAAHPTTQPRWRGEPLAGRTVLLHAEQGLGDTLQFVRYAPLVEQFGGVVRLLVQPPLLPLLRTSGFSRWLTDPNQEVACDLQCPLLSLPAFVPDANGRPHWGGNYLSADPRRVSAWEAPVRQLEGFRVGIAWAGNSDHPHDRFRSVPLQTFAALAGISGVRLVSLQKGYACGELAGIGGAFEVCDLGASVDESGGAFMDTAAIMQHLDLVIAVDTSIVHLAGGLGVTCWVPLQYSPDWRWTLHGSQTPWYPSLRLFRQSTFNVWQPVFAELASALGQRVAEARDR